MNATVVITVTHLNDTWTVIELAVGEAKAMGQRSLLRGF